VVLGYFAPLPVGMPLSAGALTGFGREKGVCTWSDSHRVHSKQRMQRELFGDAAGSTP